MSGDNFEQRRGSKGVTSRINKALIVSSLAGMLALGGGLGYVVLKWYQYNLVGQLCLPHAEKEIALTYDARELMDNYNANPGKFTKAEKDAILASVLSLTQEAQAEGERSEECEGLILGE